MSFNIQQNNVQPVQRANYYFASVLLLVDELKFYKVSFLHILLFKNCLYDAHLKKVLSKVWPWLISTATFSSIYFNHNEKTGIT